MDEFRKPYEYEEERVGGFLLFFIIMLLSTDILVTLPLVIQGYGVVVKQIPAAGAVFLVLSVLFLICIIFTVVSCFKLLKSMIVISKTYLVTRAAFMLFCLFIIYLNNLSDVSLIGVGANQFDTVLELTLVLLVFPAVYVLIFSAVWFLYFMKSKRCVELVRKSENKNCS